ADRDGTGDACECLGVVCESPGICQGVGACDATTGSCAYPNAPDGSICDDGSACTRNDACLTGICVGSPMLPKVDCNDHDRCTAESCDPELGCVHAPILCRDGDPRPTDTRDPRLGWVVIPRHAGSQNPLVSAGTP